MLLLKFIASSLQFGKTVVICSIRHDYRNPTGVCKNEGSTGGLQVTEVQCQGISLVMGH